MAVCKTLQANGEFDVVIADNVLNFKLGEHCVEAELLHDMGVLAGCKA
jgi:hypothetical protein